MSNTVSGQDVLDAWLKTHESVDEGTTQLCLNAPSFLYKFLFLPFNLENKVMAEIEMWKFLRDTSVVDAFSADYNILYLSEALKTPEDFLDFMGVTEEEMIRTSLAGYSWLVQLFEAKNLNLADILVTAPGILFDGWNEN